MRSQDTPAKDHSIASWTKPGQIHIPEYKTRNQRTNIRNFHITWKGLNFPECNIHLSIPNPLIFRHRLISRIYGQNTVHTGTLTVSKKLLNKWDFPNDGLVLRSHHVLFMTATHDSHFYFLRCFFQTSDCGLPDISWSFLIYAVLADKKIFFIIVGLPNWTRFTVEYKSFIESVYCNFTN